MLCLHLGSWNLPVILHNHFQTLIQVSNKIDMLPIDLRGPWAKGDKEER